MRFFCLFLLAAVAGLSAREVPVRYLLSGDSSEHEAVFVKIASDTVYLLPFDSAQRAYVDSLNARADAAVVKSGVTDSAADTTETGEDTAAVSEPQAAVPAAVDSAARATADSAAIPPPGASDDFEAALNAQSADSLARIKAVDDSLRAAAVADSIAKEKAKPVEQKYIRIFKYEFKRVVDIENGELVDLSQKDYVIPDSVEEEEPIYPEGKGRLLVSCSVPGCKIYINDYDLEMTTPDTIKAIKPGKYTVSVMKRLKDVNWWGTATVKITDDSLNRVMVALERPQTHLTISTVPEAVEVYLDRQPNESVMPEYTTDVVIRKMKPSLKTSIYLRKMGYLDTVVVTEVKAFMPNPVLVEMRPVDNLSVVEMQREYNSERTKRWFGRGLMWSSIAPFVGGGVLWYLAERNWSDAADKKSAYEKRSAFESADTKKLVKDNKNLNDKGDKEILAAGGLGTLGLVLLSVGFVLHF